MSPERVRNFPGDFHPSNRPRRTHQSERRSQTSSLASGLGSGEEAGVNASGAFRGHVAKQRIVSPDLEMLNRSDPLGMVPENPNRPLNLKRMKTRRSPRNYPRSSAKEDALVVSRHLADRLCFSRGEKFSRVYAFLSIVSLGVLGTLLPILRNRRSPRSYPGSSAKEDALVGSRCLPGRLCFSRGE